MSFRVLITGPHHFTNYPVLRAALDALLVNRLPAIELLTCGGRGVPMLAASDRVARRLDAVERRRVRAESPLASGTVANELDHLISLLPEGVALTQAAAGVVAAQPTTDPDDDVPRLRSGILVSMGQQSNGFGWVLLRGPV